MLRLHMSRYRYVVICQVRTVRILYAHRITCAKSQDIYIQTICRRVRKDFAYLHTSVYGNINKLSADRVFISEVDVRHQ